MNLKNFVTFYHDQDSFVFWPVISSFVLILIVVAVWGIFYLSLPEEIPIFYSESWGDNQFGHINQFLIFPSLMGLAILANLIISWHLHYSQVLIKRLLAVATFIICMLFTLGAFKIIFTFV